MRRRKRTERDLEEGSDAELTLPRSSGRSGRPSSSSAARKGSPREGSPDVSSEGDDESKRHRRLLANRRSAQRSREKRLEQVSDLELCLNELSGEVDALKAELTSWQERHQALAAEYERLADQLRARQSAQQSADQPAQPPSGPTGQGWACELPATQRNLPPSSPPQHLLQHPSVATPPLLPCPRPLAGPQAGAEGEELAPTDGAVLVGAHRRVLDTAAGADRQRGAPVKEEHGGSGRCCGRDGFIGSRVAPQPQQQETPSSGPWLGPDVHQGSAFLPGASVSHDTSLNSVRSLTFA